MTGGKLVDNIFQIDLHPVFLRGDINMSFVVDTKIVDSPPFDVIEFFGVFYTPFSHIFSISLMSATHSSTFS